MKFKVTISCLLIIGILFGFIHLSNAGTSKIQNKKIIESMQNKDTPQLILSMINSMNEFMEKDNEKFPEIIHKVEKYTQSCKDSSAVSLLHSLTAEMYKKYADRNHWKFSQRTNISGFVPEDIREWSLNLFDQKIKEELSASLKQKELLQHTATTRFDVLLEEGKDARILRPTLYDFLLQRAIEIQPSEEYYKQWIDFRKKLPEEKALVLIHLDYLNYQLNSSSITKESYNKLLAKMKKEYTSSECQLEISIAQLYYKKRNRRGHEKADIESFEADIYNYCKDNIKKYSALPRINIFKNELIRLESPFIRVRGNNNVYPGTKIQFQLEYRNVSTITIKIYENLRSPETAIRDAYRYETEKRGKLIKQQIFQLPNIPPYSEHDTLLTMPGLKNGLYEYEVTTPDNDMQTVAPFSVSCLAATARAMADGSQEIWITDFKTGKPLANVPVRGYNITSRWNAEMLDEVRTDALGIARFKKNRKLEAVRPILPGDASALLTTIRSYYWQDTKNDKIQLSLYTDRNIYRPGQTIYFKGIAYVNNKEEQQVVPQQKIKVTLTDANRQKLSNKELITNEFGSINGSFVLPQNALNGEYALRTDKDVWNFRVEAYKRPSFQLHIDSIKEEAVFGQPITITGDAQLNSGVNLQEGEVEWSIIQRPFFLRYYMPFPQHYIHEQVAAGKTQLDSKGKFNISFTPEREKGDIARNICQSYELNVKMTDNKGETQVVRHFFSVGDIDMVVNVDIKRILRKETAKATISAQTLNRQPIQTEGTYTIYTLKEKDNRSFYMGERYGKDKEITSGSFTTERPLSSEIFEALPSGRYGITVKAKDCHGKEVETASDPFILYSEQDNCPPVDLHIWQPQNQTECTPGENATILFGSSDKPAYVLYELFSEKGKLLERKKVIMNNENRRFTVPFLETYGNGITACFSFVKEGEIYTASHNIVRKALEKGLNIKAITFRDYLLPGSSETWKFRISTKENKGVVSEVLASMYDKSLDQLAPCQWNFSSYYPQNHWINFFSRSFIFSENIEYDNYSKDRLSIDSYSYDRMGDTWIRLLNGKHYYSTNGSFAVSGALPITGATRNKSTATERSDNKTINIIEDDAVIEESPVISEETVQPTAQQPDQPGPALRRNFAETAFFYPVLTSNDNGEVEFNFTVPESNTSWKLQLLAITPSLQHGYLQQNVITNKSFMVVPNLPRFLRVGDHAGLSTQIINQQSKTVKGTLTLELFNPENEKILIKLNKSFTVEAKGNSSANWDFYVPEIAGGIAGCRIVAQSDEHSDGEQHLLPVLPEDILITESYPFYLNANDRKSLKLPKETFNHPLQFTIEMTANPIWYAVQALPGISQPKHEDVLSWSASYFSSVLISSIMANYPQLKKVITAWKAEGKDKNALLSNLEKNQELKSVLLKETPWVLEAKNETEQKQQLQLLFELNNNKQFRRTAIEKIAEQQNYEGGWSWFKGMPTSRYITQQVLKSMAQLTQLKAIEYGNKEKEMQIKALNFLDRSILNDYNHMQKAKNNESKGLPNSEQIEYLWVRSLYRDIPEWGDAKDAIRYYADQAEKHWEEYSLHDRALIAMLMKTNGKQQVSKAIIATFRKTATIDKEKGMYWANNRSGQSFRNTVIDTHCLIMTAFKAAGAEQKEMNAMKQWLLAQKRVQDWGSTLSTVNAIHTLLTTGSEWIESSNLCMAEWNKHQYKSTEGEIGTGYLKATIQGESIHRTSEKKINVSNQGEAPAWGSIYLQYFTPISKIKQQKGVLNIKKELFREMNNGNERQLVAVTNEDLLKIGDKVITRLVIRNDRPMDYVALKDLRPGGFEPASRLSGTTTKDGAWCYQTTTDQSEEFFFDRLPEGTFIIEYSSFVSHSGKYSGGNATIQCLYAPEFISHTEGISFEIQ